MNSYPKMVAPYIARPLESTPVFVYVPTPIDSDVPKVEASDDVVTWLQHSWYNLNTLLYWYNDLNTYNERCKN